jgi:hypothetical protein
MQFLHTYELFCNSKVVMRTKFSIITLIICTAENKRSIITALMFCAQTDNTGELARIDHVTSAVLCQTVVGIQFRSRMCCTDATFFVRTEDIDLLRRIGKTVVRHRNSAYHIYFLNIKGSMK